MKVIAAGGVVYKGTGHQLEILLIQDRYGKVTFPKGKMEQGETVEQTAIREIREETGITGRIVKPLATTQYTLPNVEHGTITKEVHYFIVEATAGTLQAQTEEIRGVEWFAPQKAWLQQQKYGYEINRDVLLSALSHFGIEI